MDKQQMIRGYTLLESVLVLFIICMSMIWSIPLLQYDVSLFSFDSLFTSELVCLQQDAYMHNESFDIELFYNCIQMKNELFVDIDGSDFKVTKLGRVSKPVTLIAKAKKKFVEIKVWLGMGRVHVEG